MALRVLMRRKELNEAKAQLEELRKKAEGFVTREEELAKAIDEAETEEEKAVVEEEVDAFENEKEETDEAIRSFEEKVAGIEKEVAELEAEQAPAPEEEEPEEAPAEERKDEIMNKRNIFANMDVQTRTAMFEREDVKSFLEETRTCIKEKRALTNVGLTIPEVFVELLKENVLDYSKLYKHVTVRNINGNGRVLIQGTIPEAVWTDCCANLNELDLTFNDMELACWRVGGYYAVCNANLEDSEIDLASTIMQALAQAIGYALDKAVLFGLGTRMPMGIFTRLAQTEAPADYPQTARPWADLHTTNVKSIAADVTGIDLFKALIADSGAAKSKYSRGEKVWAMNEGTYTSLMANAAAMDASGAIVAGVNGTMPVIGGAIEVLDFIPDNVIVGGYYDLYVLAERAGQQFATSEHVRFLQDQTVFKGTARYDGAPAIAEAFVAIGINGTTPSASGIDFAPDSANAAESE